MLVKWGMAKPRPRPQRGLRLGEWLDAMGFTVGQAAAAANVDQSYISNMIAGRKGNPGALILLPISEMMGITINDLYTVPPPKAVLDAMHRLSPKARQRIIDGKS